MAATRCSPRASPRRSPISKIVTEVLRRLALPSLAAVVATASAASAPQAPAACGPERARYDYPLVLKGAEPLRGHRIDAVAAFARRASSEWERVPLQIDEVNARGDFVLAGGLPYTRSTDDGVFDDNDHLVLDGASAGEAFEAADVPAALTQDAVRAWRLRLCRGDATIGDLLVVAEGRRTAPWLLPPQARFAPESGEVVADLYRYVFPAANPALLGEVRLKGEGGREVALTGASRFLMPLRTPFFLPDMAFDDRDFEATVESWQTGPLRSIVAVGVKYRAFLSLYRLHLFSELVFYRNRFEIPTEIEFVFDPARFLSAGSGIAYAMSFPPGLGLEVTSNLQRLPAASAKAAVEEGPRASAFETFHAAASSPAGSLRVAVRVDEKARAQVPPPFRIEREDFADPTRRAHWPWLARLDGDLGVFLDFSGVRQGSYQFGLDLLLSAKANETFSDYGSVAPHWTDLSLGPSPGSAPLP